MSTDGDGELQRLVQSLTTGRLSRRQFIVRAAALGVSMSAIAAFLAACGSSSAPTPTAGATTASGATAAATGKAGASTSAAPASSASAGTPVNGGELKVATTTEGTTLHPYKYTDTPSGAYIDLMYLLPLLRYDKDTLELKPYAAASVQKSADNTTLTFTLRDNLQFSDGTPITATDYAWTWSKAADKANGWPNLGSYTPYIASVKDLDAKTLEVKLVTVLAISQEKVANALQYVLPKRVWENLDWSDPNTNPNIFKPTVVPGAYTLVEWKKDQNATFAANDKFFLGRPHIDRITYRIYG
ncbi:MAG TPA: ABC transporter substrate-binding protein, partial [Thermomicrobiales bacterium]